MNYDKLNRRVNAETPDMLREKLERLLRQAEEAKERNESGNVPDGLKTGIKRVRYMLRQAVGDDETTSIYV